jgi:hypothetical protein
MTQARRILWFKGILHHSIRKSWRDNAGVRRKWNFFGHRHQGRAVGHALKDCAEPRKDSPLREESGKREKSAIQKENSL